MRDPRNPRLQAPALPATLLLLCLGFGPGLFVASPPVVAATAADDTLRLDLSGCLEAALSAAPSLESAAAASRESEAVSAEAAARRQPVLGAGGSYQYASEHMRSELELPAGLPSRTLEFGDGHVASINLGLAVPLYTGGELTRTATAAAAGVEAASRREDGVRLDLARSVRVAFTGALGRQAQVEASALAVARLSRHLESVTGAEQAGAATTESVVRAQTRLALARQRHLQAEAARDSSALALGRLVGRPGVPVLPSGDVGASLLLAAGDTLPAEGPRPEVAALSAEARRQRELAAAASGRLRPRVMADVRAHYGRPGVDALANEWMGYGTAGVSVDWPLWDAGARRQRVHQAEARARWLDAQRRDLDESLTTAAATARAQLRAALAQEAQVGERLALQRRLLEMVAGRQALDSATETEFLDAHDDLAQAEVDLALVRTRVRQAESFLLWTLGR